LKTKKNANFRKQKLLSVFVLTILAVSLASPFIKFPATVKADTGTFGYDTAGGTGATDATTARVTKWTTAETLTVTHLGTYIDSNGAGGETIDVGLYNISDLTLLRNITLTVPDGNAQWIEGDITDIEIEAGEYGLGIKPQGAALNIFYDGGDAEQTIYDTGLAADAFLPNPMTNDGNFARKYSIYANYTTEDVPATGSNMALTTVNGTLQNELNDTVVLHGAWKGDYADSAVGWWDASDPYTFNEAVMNSTMDTLIDTWHFNCINFFVWGDWWLENKDDTLTTPDSCDMGNRDAIIRTVEVAEEKGLYVQIRLYGCTRAEGRLEGVPYTPTYSWSEQNFIDFWVDVSDYLKGYSNVIYTLFDEPSTGQSNYFSVANQTIAAIRANGDNNCVCVHWSYCGNCEWMETWENAGYPTDNIIFSNHIYRWHGTYMYDSNYATDYDSIETFLLPKWSSPGYNDHGGYAYIQNTYNLTIWVSAIGSHYGTTNDAEYIAFVNALAVLNTRGIGYCAFGMGRTTGAIWGIAENQGSEDIGNPNRVGQALIDAIMDVAPDETYQLTVNSEPSNVQYTVNGTEYTTTQETTLFAGNYSVVMPSSINEYTHNVLFGNTTGEGGSGTGYSNYMYASGNFTVVEDTNASLLYVYIVNAGNAKFAIYNDTSHGHPDSLLAYSGEIACNGTSWNEIAFSQVEFVTTQAYHIVMKMDTNGMKASVASYYHGDYIATAYNNAFPSTFGTPDGQVGAETVAYVASSELTYDTWYFGVWEDESTNRIRNINLTTDTEITAYYNSTETVYTLTMQVTEGGLITPSEGEHDYAEDYNVTLTATPSESYSFAAWEIDGSNETTTESTWYVVMDGDHTAKAYFIASSPSPTATPEPVTVWDLGSDVSLLLVYLQSGDLIGFIIACYTSRIGQLFYVILILCFTVPLALRTQSITYVAIVWLICGAVMIPAVPLISPAAVILLILGIAGLIYRVYTNE
jgi:hypothetical protein